MHPKKITVIGLGYIGLPTAALLASKGYKVSGIDIDSKVVRTVNQGAAHIDEPKLDLLVKDSVTNGKLKAFTFPQMGDVYLICVPTPFFKTKATPQPNVDYVLSATKSISALIKPDDLIVLESTSPVGTTEQIRDTLKEEGVNVDAIHIAYCPERVLPGKILSELVENDRVVGGLTHRATDLIAEFYGTFTIGDVLKTNAKTAEMCKLTENSFRDVNIAFANELSLLCVNKGINVWELVALANKHPRVNILQPGPGVGGHCIAVDPWFIVSMDNENSRLIRTGREVNTNKTEWVISQIKSSVEQLEAKTRKKPKIICMGIAFKPNVGDLRESPALFIVESLMADGFEVSVIEPNLDTHPEIRLVGADAIADENAVVVILVKHREFFEEPFTKKLKQLKALDFCGLLGLQR